MKLNRLLFLCVLSLSSIQITPRTSEDLVRLKEANKGGEAYYLVGNFNSYQTQDEYKFSKNYNEIKFEEYKLTVSLDANSSFYVSNLDGSKIFTRPDGQEFLISEEGEYEFKFSPDFDYGHENHLHYVKNQVSPEARTITIETKEDLIKLIDLCQSDYSSENLTVELNKDLDLENMIIQPINIFNGTFKGNNHTIKNFRIDYSLSGQEAGFIRKLTKKGKVEGLNLIYRGEISHDDTLLGGIVGVNEGEVISCSFQGNLKGNNVIGGIVGSNKKDAKIISCTNKGRIEGKIIAGGICGNNKGEILSSVNKGDINQDRFSSLDEMLISNIGGITGFNHGLIKESKNQGKVGVKQLGSFIGGISGSSLGEISSCDNEAPVSGNSSVGGVVGYFAELTKRNNDDAYNNLITIIQKIIDGLEGKDKPTESLESTYASRITYCYNTSMVNGDSNIGGIVGYASNEHNRGGDIHGFSVSKCLNQGEIKGTKNSVGGIVGNHLIGEIDSSFNDGLIDSSSADYVGGIVGSSTGQVLNCFSSGELAGNNYVGGIGGSNKTLKDCYSLTSIKCGGSFVGSLSGYIASLDKNVVNNYYVGNSYNGIDNVDYLNKSTRITRDSLASKEMLNVSLNPQYWLVGNDTLTYPMIRSLYEMELDTDAKKFIYDSLIQDTKFGCYVSFINGDDRIIKKVFVPYGQDLDLNMIPDVPEKEGYFAKWEKFQAENIKNNIFVKVIYDQIITSIANEEGPTPSLIVEGKFNDKTKVNMTFIDEDILDKNSQYTYRGTFKFNLEGNDDLDSSFKVKYRLPDKISSPSIKELKDGKLIDVDTSIEGNYICFDGEENHEYVLLEKSFCSWNNPLFIVTISLSSLGGVLIISGLTYLIIRKSKKKNSQKK